MATNGLVVMTPTSIASTGTGNSSSINADGSVDFASCETLSLNGVFTSGYDNYMVAIRYLHSSAPGAFYVRLRASGIDQASGGYYARQILFATGTDVGAARATSQNEARIGNTSNAAWSGDAVYFFGPYLTQPTAFRNTQAGGGDNGAIRDWACTHSLSSSYDGLTFFPPTTSSVHGLLTVFGFNQ